MKYEVCFYQNGEKDIVVNVIEGSAQEITCNGSRMTKIEPNTSEGAQEKHLPVVEQQGNEVTVKVGDIFHPMQEDHSIQWVYLQSQKGCQMKFLSPGGEPVATFQLCGQDTPVAAYAYCNLHGFWKTQL